MAKESGYVGRYGDTLRKLTALDAQAGKFAPQQIGGADVGGFGPSLQLGGAAPAPELSRARMPSEAPQQSGSGFAAQPATGGGAAGGFGPQMPSIISDDPANGGISGTLGKGGSGGIPGIAGPIETGGDKPTSWGDLTSGSTPEQREELAKQIEQSSGKPLKSLWKRVQEGLGLDKAPKFERGEMALYLSEVALRAMSKRGRPEYEQNPSGVFADALLETHADYESRKETLRKEKRSDDETLRKENREDSIHARDRGEKESDHKRDRAEKIEDDKRNHQQALELAREQARLLKEKGKKTSIVTADDGTLKLIDTDTGDAVPVTETVTTTRVRGSRGKGKTNVTVTEKRPVKAAPKSNSAGLDQDTVQRMISDRIKELAKTDRTFRKKPPEEQSRIATKLVLEEVNSVKGGAGANPFDKFDSQQE